MFHLIGQSEPQARSPSRSTTATEAISASAPVNIPVATSSSNGRRECDTPNPLNGSYTGFPLTPSLPTELPNLTRQPPTYHSPYPLFQDPNTQAVFTQAVTQLAVLMNGGRLPPQMGHLGGFPGVSGSTAAMSGFNGSPGWGTPSAWPPSTPMASGYSYDHFFRQHSFRNPYATQRHHGMGPSFPPSQTFPSSMSQPEPTPVVQDAKVVQEKTAAKARSRSKSRRRVTFASDCDFAPADRPGDPAEKLQREDENPLPMRRGRSRTRGTEDPTSQTNRKGKSKVDEADQGLESDAGSSGDEGGVDRHSSPKSCSKARGRTSERERR